MLGWQSLIWVIVLILFWLFLSITHPDSIYKQVAIYKHCNLAKSLVGGCVCLLPLFGRFCHCLLGGSSIWDCSGFVLFFFASN